MYRIVLVDDEQWILESLKGTVDWGAHGFAIAGEASNGLEAWERIQELRPELVFVDVRMPGMNGLQLIKRIYEAGLPVQCIVASGYDEFEYARQAMQYGAVGYCLKPFSEPEIVELLEKVKAGIHRSQLLVEHELLRCIQEQSGETAQEAELEQLLEQGLFGWKPGMSLVVVVVHAADAEAADLVTAGASRLKLRIGSGKTAYVLHGEALETAKARAASGALPEAVRGIGISPVDPRAGRLRQLIEAANIASYRSFTSGEIVGLSVGAPQSDELDAETWRPLEEGIRDRNVARLRQIFAGITPYFESGRYDIRHAYRLYNRVLAYLPGGEQSGGADSAEPYCFDYDELVRVYGCVTRMFEGLLAIAADSFVPAADTGPESRGPEVLQQIVHYVNAHYRESISVNEIAKKFYMHPNYLSLLFKKELHVNFTKYMVDLRMDYACQLLRGTSAPVSEIAERAGYSDYFYFAKLFKKHRGMTPTEYRASES